MSGGQWMEPLRALYEQYIATVEHLEKNAKFGAGWFGLPGGPKNDGCHERFAQDVKALIGELAAAGPDPDQAREAVEYILRAPEEHKDDQTMYWMFQAVHSMLDPLTAYLDPADAEQLWRAYAKQYRRWERLPAQKAALAALDRARKKT